MNWVDLMIETHRRRLEVFEKYLNASSKEALEGAESPKSPESRASDCTQRGGRDVCEEEEEEQGNIGSGGVLYDAHGVVVVPRWAALSVEAARDGPVRRAPVQSSRRRTTSGGPAPISRGSHSLQFSSAPSRSGALRDPTSARTSREEFSRHSSILTIAVAHSCGSQSSSGRGAMRSRSLPHFRVPPPPTQRDVDSVMQRLPPPRSSRSETYDSDSGSGVLSGSALVGVASASPSKVTSRSLSDALRRTPAGDRAGTFARPRLHAGVSAEPKGGDIHHIRGRGREEKLSVLHDPPGGCQSARDLASPQRGGTRRPILDVSE